ncbi:MAG: hypothetical protein A3E21_01200 [Sulfurimonas sp. RIFCSPHIGHO2_12_FULL_36_9]|uniref:Lnb N-terminal periplasmic domain-containing protein n=1 Tax=Sulfurimonas sp. RIFCSPLOWO2_12_36_12 TaxID=1802253 RepID=UPI0008CEB356|nr:DUF4105 domain-containing protein [Sulfurimonas sp. RIFCSPLOWO2_12_36_12]OHD96659.1 MAG: hypothetical protein A3E21_01200 [Sulfurimonas sp. RIFCSPHIGHO2_12_FULL_36_9]OHE00177.1 MAG: hypothetical protein A2W82_02915 [Sulfurimonas sp. RIFCSPLOWO2_12_36_12]OHE08556.1 MAG: hypothetical protein A3K14_04400 [Sulfurimonas sp. RIFCSPLOWO2_12_FULL_36_74]
MENGVSQIDDKRFFLALNGKTNAKNELNATIDALLNETIFDDNSTACRFPARKAWLQEQLNITKFADVNCTEYDKVLKRLNPKSATLVFPSAHINSPASMFGHTFLRINSAYNSKLLSYAVNYAADADPNKENGALFAIKGLFGGYYGKYSLLPYYDKLKEYRDSEQRDVWEYDLDLSEEEVLRMVRHIWELNETHSSYYFFTENCSYNMLWFLEAARPGLDLRKYFNFQVIPLETVHATKSEKIISSTFYRPSKRTILLKYEELINEEHIRLPIMLANSAIDVSDVINREKIDVQQKMYILEASIELLEYNFSKSKIKKEEYLKLFHAISKARAALGQGNIIDIKTPPNPIESHQAIKTSIGGGFREGNSIGFLGLRPAYHDLEDSNYGFLRGTQIEFLNLELSYSQNKLDVENATILSIVSLAQRSEFFENLSWRTKFGWDKDSLDSTPNFIGTIGAGLSWGNELGYLYIMADPLFYLDGGFKSAIGSSLGFIFDKFSYMSTNLELTRRWYDTGDAQNLIGISQNFRLSQNAELKFKYDYKERSVLDSQSEENSFKIYINCYF